MAQNNATADSIAIQQALIALEDEYNIPRNNPLHTLLTEMRDKYASVLGLDTGATQGGGTDKSG